jgi:hypothetical protein
MSTVQLFRYPGVARVVLIYNYVMLLAFTYTAVNPVFQYTPVRLGGIGFSPELIAAVTALSGAAQATWLLLAFPRLHKRVGTGRVLFYCACAWPVFFASSVVFNILLRHRLTAVFWATALPTLIIGSGVAMAFSTFFPNTSSIFLLTQISCRSACGERHCTVSRNPWNPKCYCSGHPKWYSRCRSCSCNQHICDRRKVPYLGRTALLASQYYASSRSIVSS